MFRLHQKGKLREISTGKSLLNKVDPRLYSYVVVDLDYNGDADGKPVTWKIALPRLITGLCIDRGVDISCGKPDVFVTATTREDGGHY